MSVVDLRFEDDGLARLRLTRPEAHNAIDRTLVDELHDAAAACAARPDLRALLIEAEGANFTVGGDLRHLNGVGDDLPAELQRMISRYHAGLAQLGALEVPVVTAVQGAAAGGGLGLLWCADVVILADDARLASGFARLGMTGDGGSSWAVTRLAGSRRAWEFLAEGRVLNAQEAVEWGLVSRVVPAAELAEEAERSARTLAAGPTRAYAHLRRLIGAASRSSWPEQLDAERQVMAELALTEDVRAGIGAFVEKRAPVFRGR
ncbi:enoyl-CoA hydratase-related protein [Conexibacter sp. JD483]|uniref:enoyl-CoA hydratase/isomerase family protein n=1 Tax=unclassified Conexibacter TaxID=2627773 RepID=UPI0027206CFD|nr:MULTISPECIES: enoyl-CoA hydratase-related protein [unclassified Conexibacter]MDO8187726.1 enoyl-CoA hydratase-related protein [Conexibacter sp. CPCC 205706]MDO8200229.1 enoyl-CoA hydratase-related protein [Conexibacter sp. CPCC 205762]MDR9369405.1 enoyl-CoA hydratase-related protein [Conexibacter sp. JD483]